MNKFLQTVIFFALTSVMVTFIYSVLRPAQYLAENEFLVISNSVESNCDKELGATLARAITSETFQKEIEGMQEIKQEIILADYIKIKNYKNTNIVNVHVKGSSLASTQKLIEDIQKVVSSQGYKYYSVQDKVTIQTLINPRIIRTPKIILENTLKALLAGVILGSLIAFLTGLRLDIFAKRKNIQVTSQEVKEKKTKGISSKDRNYKDIIKKRLEKELSKEPIKDLAVADEGYIFGEINKIKSAKTPKEAVATLESTSPDANVRVIAASTMIVGKHDKEIEADKVPENLPIFIEEKLPKNNTEQKESTKGSISSIQSDSKDTIARATDEQEGKSVEKTSLKKSNLPMKNKKRNTSSSASKKASAHDIANGFAPDLEDKNGPTNEEIKDRLNKLLKGEL